MKPQTTQTSPSAPSPSSAVNSPSPTDHLTLTTNHSHSSFAQFTQDQLLQISAWLDDHIYEQVIKLTKNKYKRIVSRSALQRFYRGTAFKNRLAETPDTEAAAAQILQFAATGQPNFTQASLNVLEQTAFQLSATCHQQPEDLAILNRITHIITRHKNTAIRERHATVQEEKCRLRHDQLKARQVEVQVRERQKQQHLDHQHDQLQLQRDKFDFQKQQAEKKHTTRNTSSSLGVPALAGLPSPMPNENFSMPHAQCNSPSSASSASSRALCVNPSPSAPSHPPKDPHPHIKGNNYLDQTNQKIWILATDTPVLPFTDTAMKHEDRRNPPPPVDHSLTPAVQAYVDRRAQDYRDYLAAPPHPNRIRFEYDYYQNTILDCPCGQPKFCPRHIFTALFSYAHPWSHAFRQSLLDRGLPYVPPTDPFPGNKPNI
jgi:hypothetical protein